MLIDLFPKTRENSRQIKSKAGEKDSPVSVVCKKCGASLDVKPEAKKTAKKAAAATKTAAKTTTKKTSTKKTAAKKAAEDKAE